MLARLLTRIVRLLVVRAWPPVQAPAIQRVRIMTRRHTRPALEAGQVVWTAPQPLHTATTRTAVAHTQPAHRLAVVLAGPVTAMLL